MRIARQLGHRITAIADPSAVAIGAMREIAGEDAPEIFETGERLLARERLADVALISTQDAQHFSHASAALRCGYDVLLEKPAAQSSEQVEELARIAREQGRKLILCFVLRYTPFYRALKKALDDGKIGDVVSMQASEGVGPWHNAHSYVRGKWAKTAETTPMIIAKCSHDTDILAWFAESRAVSVTSHERISHFRSDKAPEGATARCTDACPHVGSCLFDAHRYLRDKRSWLRSVHPDAEQMDDAAITRWLETSDWGRCVYHSDQDTPDHQVVAMKFQNGITADLTMTAFDTGRRIRIYGSKGILEGAMGCDGRASWIECRLHEGATAAVEIEEGSLDGYESHGGGDSGLIAALPGLLSGKARGTGDFIEGHRIGFAADLATKEGRVVRL
jgi:predicted dehydrogenase